MVKDNSGAKGGRKRLAEKQGSARERTAAPASPGSSPFRPLAKLVRERPTDAVAAFGGVGAALLLVPSTLGYLALNARGALLDGLPLDLQYPKQRWIAEGFDVCRSLIGNALRSLVSDHWALRSSAWACVLFLIGMLALARLGPRGTPILVSFLGATSIAFFLGSLFYRIAIHQVMPCSVSGTLADNVAVEACSWLINDTEQASQRREALAGLLTWLLAVCLAGVWIGSHRVVPSNILSRLRWSAVIVSVVTALLMLSYIPRAYAFSEWGIRYPEARIKGGPGCDAELAKSVAEKKCCAFDVSSGATKGALLIRGLGCPPLETKVRNRLETGLNPACWQPTSLKRVIIQGCG